MAGDATDRDGPTRRADVTESGRGSRARVEPNGRDAVERAPARWHSLAGPWTDATAGGA